MPFLKMYIDFYDKWNIAEREHKCYSSSAEILQKSV